MFIWLFAGILVLVQASDPTQLQSIMRSHQYFPNMSQLRLDDQHPLILQDEVPLAKGDGNPTVFLFRHAEKPLDHSDKRLSEKGWERAFALAARISLGTDFPDRIDEIYAASYRQKNTSIRSIQTAIPTALLFQKPIFAFYDVHEVHRLLPRLKNRGNRTILVFWEHKKLHQILEALLNSTDVPLYPEDRFDEIWKVSSNASFSIFHQELLSEEEKSQGVFWIKEGTSITEFIATGYCGFLVAKKVYQVVRNKLIRRDYQLIESPV